ncbi:MAG: hypothetical protein ABEH43_07575, partial [Flavobacteriales bacterium]
VNLSTLDPNNISANIKEDTIIKGDSTQISAIPNNNNFEYSWNPTKNVKTPNESSSVVSPTTTTTYNIKVQEQSTCSGRDSVNLVVWDAECGPPDLYIPN